MIARVLRRRKSGDEVLKSSRRAKARRGVPVRRTMPPARLDNKYRENMRRLLHFLPPLGLSPRSTAAKTVAAVWSRARRSFGGLRLSRVASVSAPSRRHSPSRASSSGRERLARLSIMSGVDHGCVRDRRARSSPDPPLRLARPGRPALRRFPRSLARVSLEISPLTIALLPLSPPFALAGASPARTASSTTSAAPSRWARWAAAR